jgi:hypothetical protein
MYRSRVRGWVFSLASWAWHTWNGSLKDTHVKTTTTTTRRRRRRQSKIRQHVTQRDHKVKISWLLQQRVANIGAYMINLDVVPAVVPYFVDPI